MRFFLFVIAGASLGHVLIAAEPCLEECHCQPPHRLEVLEAEEVLEVGVYDVDVSEKHEAASLQRRQIAAAVEAVYPALVRIEVISSAPGNGRIERQRGFGSGTIIDQEGHVLTNHHVAGHAQTLRVTLADRRVVDAVLVGTDPLSDLAVIRLVLEEEEVLPVAEFGDSDQLEIGDLVMAMGSPAGLSQSVTVGVVANTEMITPYEGAGLHLDGERVGELVRWIGHDAVIAGGNSGGPLVNGSGQIIGINEVGISSIGGAIPANLAQSVAAQLIAEGEVKRSSIGITTQRLLREQKDLQAGILVASVLEEGPAAEAGLQPGDILTHFQGEIIPPARAREDLPVFNRMVLETPIGETVVIGGLREGKEQQWQVITTERYPAQYRPEELLNWGILAKNLTPAMARELGLADSSGVQVYTTRPGRGAANASPQLHSGDVIIEVSGQEIANVAELQSWTEEFLVNQEEPQDVLVRFLREGREMVSLVRVGAEPEQQAGRRIETAWLGASVQAVTQDLAEALGYKGKSGVFVTQVLPNSPAENAGIQVNDFITHMEQRLLNIRREEDAAEFSALIRQYRPEDLISVTVLRDQQETEIEIELGRSPLPANEQPEKTFSQLEFSVRLATEIEREEQRSEQNFTQETNLVVSSVEQNGWANLAGLEVGDLLLTVNGEVLSSLEELETSVQQAFSQQQAILFFVLRNKDTKFVEIVLP